MVGIHETQVHMYCEIILFHEHELSWLDDETYIRGFQITCKINKVNQYFV